MIFVCLVAFTIWLSQAILSSLSLSNMLSFMTWLFGYVKNWWSSPLAGSNVSLCESSTLFVLPVCVNAGSYSLTLWQRQWSGALTCGNHLTLCSCSFVHVTVNNWGVVFTEHTLVIVALSCYQNWTIFSPTLAPSTFSFLCWQVWV